MQDSVLLLSDLYESLCFGSQPPDERRLDLLQRFFEAFLNCWSQTGCVRIPPEFSEYNDPCRFISRILVWLKDRDPSARKVFDLFTQQNLQTNIELLEDLGISYESLQELNDFVTLEDPSEFLNRMESITMQLMRQTNYTNMGFTLLGLLGALTFGTNPSSTATSAVSVNTSILKEKDVVFVSGLNHEPRYLIFEMHSGYLRDTKKTMYQIPRIITQPTTVYAGEFVVSFQNQCTVFSSGVVDTTVSIYVQPDGSVLTMDEDGKQQFVNREFDLMFPFQNRVAWLKDSKIWFGDYESVDVRDLQISNTLQDGVIGIASNGQLRVLSLLETSRSQPLITLQDIEDLGRVLKENRVHSEWARTHGIVTNTLQFL